MDIVDIRPTSAIVGHSVSDADGYLLAMDPGICEIMQRSQRELLGVAYTDLTHPDDRTRNVALVARLGIFEGPLRIRKRYVRPDGSAVWADVQVSRMYAGRDQGRLVGTIHLLHPGQADRSPESLWRAAMRADEIIRQRRIELGDDLFSDHAWIILLQVYLAEAEGRIVNADTIAERADIRPAIVERWLRALAYKRLVDRPEWLGFAAQLTTDGITRVERLLDGTIQN